MKVKTNQKLNFIAITKKLIEFQGDNESYSLFQFYSFVSGAQYWKLYQLVSKYIPANGELLDWGCGNGHFSYASILLGYQTSGFSFDLFLLTKYLKEHLDYKFCQGNSQEPTVLPYADESFDAVTSVGVIEHVRETGGNESDSLRQINRVLKSDGYFICYHLPNQFSWIEFVNSFLPHKHHHTYRYTKSQIEALFTESGFKIIEIYRYGFLPRNILGKLPNSMKYSTIFPKIYNICDNILSFLFSIVCQNYVIVARKVSD